MFLDKENAVLYVGKAKDLKSRVSSYFANNTLLGDKTKLLVTHIEKIRITIVESELEALLLEAFYIKQHKPKYNIRLMDNKSYIRIRITVKDKYPRVLLARNEDDEKSVYFGPYPNAGAVRMVLKIIRKIFPFQSVLNHPKRICLYNHLGLCPCPPMNDSPNLQKEYRKNIKGIIRILEGESKKIMKEMEKQRDALSLQEKYEEALQMQKKIQALGIITTPFRRPFEYDVNPNLRADIRQKELDELREAISTVILRPKAEESRDPSLSAQDDNTLRRIECYDISNISGTNATGSMVVLTHGEIDKSQYRKFKIRRENKPNDFAMMKEVLKRRLTHDEWNTPDLIIVDGGKGQVSSAMEVLQELGLDIPLIGLAKREETIITPDNREISLPKNSPALHLITRIRDEAHRFAITYHRKLRSKGAIS